MTHTFPAPVADVVASAQQSGEWRCPRCLGPVEVKDERITCTSCDARYSIREGIYDFRVHRHDYYFNPVPREEMTALVSAAAARPWDDSVRHFLRFVRNVPDWIDNVEVNGRYTWKLFLELRADSRVLDFGCGLGNLTRNVAPHVGEVVALDLTWERLQFARERFAKFNADDRITLVAGGDGPHLPFPDAHFDAIALSGVFEWIADDVDPSTIPGARIAKALRMLMTFFGERNPRRTQVRFLRELHRVLKPDGQLFIAIENRWGYEYFTGRPDHHSGLPAGSLLPRFVANAYSIVRKHRPYRTYTHTFGGLRRVLRDGGFVRTEVYGLSPGYSSLGEILPAATDQPFWQPTRPTFLADRIRRGRRFVPAFGIVGQRSATRPTPLVARLLECIGQAIPGSPRLQLHDCRVTGKDKAVLMASAGPLQVVIKLPASDSARAGEAHHHAILELLNRRGEAIAPQPLGQGNYQGVAWFAEHRMRGVPLSRASTVDRDRAAILVAKFVKRLGPPVADTAALQAYREHVRSLVTRCFAMLVELGIERRALEPTFVMIEALLASPTINVGLSHGDLSASNLFVEGGDVCGAIDWEYASEHGLPPLDFLAFMESRQRLADPRSTAGAAFLALGLGDWPCKAELAALAELYAVYGLRQEDHEALCRLAWLTHVAHQLDTTLRFDAKAVRRLVDPVVQSNATVLRTGP